MDILGPQKLVPKSSSKTQSDHGPLQFMLNFKSLLHNGFANDSKLQIENESQATTHPSNLTPTQDHFTVSIL